MRRYKQSEIDEVSKILKNNGVISVSTDTVYGLCASSNSRKAYDKLISIKNRPDTKPFPIMCINETQIKDIAIVNLDTEKLIHAWSNYSNS